MAHSLPQHPTLSVGAVALAVVALLGCGDSSPAPPPSAPPPFQPQAVEVKLGESDQTVTLMTAQGGGFTKDGQPFASGTDVEAANGNTYKLTLQGGQWSAAYVAPDAQELPLGISGTTVSVSRQEDGSYAIDGEAIEDGQVVPSNLPGVEYTLALGDDGQWTATYAPPPAETVSLGDTGQTIDLVRQENGRWAVDGVEIGTDSRYVAPDGRAYNLLRTLEGGWVAVFVSTEVEVSLGTTGDTVTIWLLEDGSVTFNGVRKQSGEVIVADNGASYRLSLSAGGWTAEFVPSDQRIALGASGATVSLTQQEDGSFLLNGRPFASGGTHTAGNGSVYRLTWSDGSWMVQYLPPPPYVLTLGMSGETITIERGEVGTYSANGTLVSNGSTYVAGNGSSYQLTQVGEAWIANYVMPEPVILALGDSGSSIRIERHEDGTFSSGGIIFDSGAVFKALNGKEYRVTLEDGVWMAAFAAPEPTVVPLGTSGHTVELTLQENGTYALDGAPFASGGIVTTDDGDRYRLTRHGDAWTAALLPPPTTTVALGTSGQTVTVTENPDGSYEVNGQRIESGDTFTTDGGSVYRLTLSGTEWSADFVGGTVVVPLGNTGGTVLLTLDEDGTYKRNGRTFRSGQVVVYLDLEYRLTLDGDEWTAELVGIAGTPIDPTTPTGPTTPDIPEGGDRIEVSLGTEIGLREVGETTVADEGTILVIAPGDLDLEYTIDELTAGSGVLIMQTFVDRAQAQLLDLIAELDKYQTLYDVEVVDPDEHIRTGIDGGDGLWERAQAVMEGVFGANTSPLDDSPWPGSSVEADEVDDVREALQSAITALSSLSAFENEFDGQFDTTDAEVFFEAQLSKIRFGGSSNVRYGAFAVKQNATSALDGTWTQGVFAYSPLERPATSDLPDRGEAIYGGQTVAVDSAADTPELYTGNIELTVRFSTGRVDGSVSDLESEDGAPWEYNSEPVEEVQLATAAMGTRGRFTVSNGTATVQFPVGRGINTQVKGSGLAGQFIDGDDEMFGTWSVGTTMEGAFGARYSSSQTPQRPDVDDDGDIAETSVNLEPDGDGMLTMDGHTFEASRIYSARGESETGQNLASKARGEVSDARSTLSALVRAGDSDSSSRKDLWAVAVDGLELVFGDGNTPSGFGTSFPTGSDADDDADDLLQDAINALGSESRFLSAQETDEIFADSSFTEDEISDIFDAVEFDFDLRFDATNLDYTRFGAWSSERTDAANAEPELVTGSFAYSPLAQSNFSGSTPYDFRAEYEGEALAVLTGDGSLYRGDFHLTVDWSPTGTNTVSSYVEDLRTVSGGDYLQYGGFDVRYIQFYNVTADSSGDIGLAGSVTVTLRYQDSRIDDTTLPGTNSLEGKFVGTSIDGPLGVIGAWTIDASSEIGMKGAFGAELAP